MELFREGEIWKKHKGLYIVQVDEDVVGIDFLMSIEELFEVSLLFHWKLLLFVLFFQLVELLRLDLVEIRLGCKKLNVESDISDVDEYCQDDVDQN